MAEIFAKDQSHRICGHWNGSPVEIGVTDVMYHIPTSEDDHYHAYHEYYVILEGRAELDVEGTTFPMEAETVVMVNPGEKHRVKHVDPDCGVRWVIVKQKSMPNSKHVV